MVVKTNSDCPVNFLHIERNHNDGSFFQCTEMTAGLAVTSRFDGWYFVRVGNIMSFGTLTDRLPSVKPYIGPNVSTNHWE